jgi:hypothetical protein
MRRCVGHLMLALFILQCVHAISFDMHHIKLIVEQFMEGWEGKIFPLSPMSGETKADL